MTTEYHTIRVTPEIYRRVLEVKRMLEDQNQIPASIAGDTGSPLLTQGKVISAALEALVREIEFAKKIRVDEDEDEF